MKFYSKTDFDSCLWQEQLFYWAYVVIRSFSLAAHKCWWTWKTFLSKKNDQIISIKSCYFSTGYRYSIWYFKTRPWTCTTIPHLSNTHGYPKTKFRAKQRRRRAITSARSTVMLSWENEHLRKAEKTTKLRGTNEHTGLSLQGYLNFLPTTTLKENVLKLHL